MFISLNYLPSSSSLLLQFSKRLYFFVPPAVHILLFFQHFLLWNSFVRNSVYYFLSVFYCNTLQISCHFGLLRKGFPVNPFYIEPSDKCNIDGFRVNFLLNCISHNTGKWSLPLPSPSWHLFITF